MTSINELFPKCGKLAYDARQLLSQVQNNHGGATADLMMVLDELDRQLDVMEKDFVWQETPAQREKWKRKIVQLRHESTLLRQQGTACRNARNTSAYHSEHAELLRRRRGGGRDQVESDMHNYAQEQQSLDQSNMMANSLIAQGEASLQDLVAQRNRLRNVRGVLTDIGNRLGITDSTMRIIERRDITDAYLVAAGMVVTCLVFYFVWF